MEPVVRTARDALQAKVSALLSTGYELSSSFADDAADPNATSFGSRYLALLQVLSEKLQLGGLGRQSPLVNAGYATRALTLQEQVFCFLHFHRSNNHRRGFKTSAPLRFVILGAGFDVLGLAAAQSFDNVHLVEIDFPSICEAKQAAVQDMELAPNSTCNLVPGDLRELEKLQSSLSNLAMADLSCPTLILSELVLAYLPAQACDNLLQWLCTTFLLNSPGSSSAMILYEPIGKPSNNDSKVQGVVEGYQQVYLDQFQEKLERGKKATKTKGLIFPLGQSTSAVSARLQPFRANVVTAERASFQSLVSLKMPEMFDEHAALRLYLRSYCLCRVFDHESSGMLPRIMCAPRGSYSLMPPSSEAESQSTLPDGSVWISSIQSGDEADVQKIFKHCYEHLFQRFPSVHKMVKAALKKDLASGNAVVGGGSSAIGGYYREQMGLFKVAVLDPNPEQCRTGEKSPEPRVIGAIGIRRCHKDEKGVRGSHPGVTFEIHRLFVDPSHRSCGVGRNLFAVAAQSLLRQTRRDIHFVATTLNILEQANRFYEKQGFEVVEEETTSDFVLRTFHKHVVNETTIGSSQ